MGTLKKSLIPKIALILFSVFLLQYFIWQRYLASRLFGEAGKIGSTIGFFDAGKKQILLLARAINLNPLDSEYYFRSGKLFFEDEDYLRSQRMFAASLFLEPVNPDYHLGLALLYDASSDPF